VLDAKGEVWRTFIVMVPTLGAALITGTRIMDARHHPFDVISGALLGILVSWASYRQYFPPVTETWRKGRAYPIRAWGRGPAPPPNPNPTIMIDEDVQPLRPMDAERGEASGYSTTTAAPRAGDHEGNVFRQQISDSQRRRQNPYAVDRSDTLASSNYRSDLPDNGEWILTTTLHPKMATATSFNPVGSPTQVTTGLRASHLNQLRRLP
jgi:diacylglycerol diphosphate phosphatase/phosphatidate phosphatase